MQAVKRQVKKLEKVLKRLKSKYYGSKRKRIKRQRINVPVRMTTAAAEAMTPTVAPLDLLLVFPMNYVFILLEL